MSERSGSSRVLLQRARAQRRELGQKLSEHAVGPAKSDLQSIFAARSSAAAVLLRPEFHIVLFDQDPRVQIALDVLARPAVRDLARKVALPASR